MGTTLGNGWTALADLLRRRRIELGYRTRTAFTAHVQDMETGRGAARIIGAVENAERDNYRPDTLVRIEAWYELPAGTIARVVSGDTPDPAPTGPHQGFITRRRDDTSGRDLWTLILPNGAQATCSLPAGSTQEAFVAELDASAEDIAWSLGVTPDGLRRAAGLAD